MAGAPEFRRVSAPPPGLDLPVFLWPLCRLRYRTDMAAEGTAAFAAGRHAMSPDNGMNPAGDQAERRCLHRPRGREHGGVRLTGTRVGVSSARPAIPRPTPSSRPVRSRPISVSFSAIATRSGLAHSSSWPEAVHWHRVDRPSGRPRAPVAQSVVRQWSQKPYSVGSNPTRGTRTAHQNVSGC
jgi:hypothetical protein